MNRGVYPMGKSIKCHLGYFELPSEIYGFEISDEKLEFNCEDGDYEAKEEDNWTIHKICNKRNGS